MDDRDLREQLLPRIVRLRAESVDPNLLAAYVDGSLSPEEHREVASRIAADPDALLFVRALAADRRRERLAPYRIAAMAAALLLGLGLWWASDHEPAPASPDLTTRLADVGARLAREAPELLADFAPLSGDALRTEGSVTRGGPAWIAPSGLLLQAPHTLRWRNPPGASRVEISLSGPGTNWVREVDGESVDAPALAPGRYVVRLRALDALAGQPIRRVFELADDRTRLRHERALDFVQSRAPADLADLLGAHYAVRARLYEQARPLLRAAIEGGGEAAQAARALDRHLDVVAGPQR